MLCVQFLFWYIAHNWNYGILATPARTIVKTRLKNLAKILGQQGFCLSGEKRLSFKADLKIYSSYVRVFTVLHFEHKNNVTIIVKPVYRATSRNKPDEYCTV